VSAGVKLNPGAYFTPVFRTGAKLTPGLKNAYFLRVASKYLLTPGWNCFFTTECTKWCTLQGFVS